MRAGRLVDRQRQVDQDLADEKHRAGVAVEQQRVLAAPAQARLFGQRQLHHGRRIGEDAIAEGADFALDAGGQLLQPAAPHLGVIAAARIHRYHRRMRVLQAQRLALAPVLGGRHRQIIHACADGAHRARNQFGGTRTLHAVACHIIHLAVMAGGQPRLQARLGRT